jgi:hypothetical protein
MMILFSQLTNQIIKLLFIIVNNYTDQKEK